MERDAINDQRKTEHRRRLNVAGHSRTLGQFLKDVTYTYLECEKKRKYLSDNTSINEV